MALGGGPPGLAILTGVAKGVREEREKERERRRQAVLDRLRETQVEQAQQSIDISAAREERLRQMFEAQQAQADAQQDAAEAAEARRQRFLQGRVPELVDSGMTRSEAVIQAGREFDKGVAPTVTSDRAADQAEAERDAEMDQLRQTEARQRIADRAEGEQAEANLDKLQDTEAGLRLTEAVRSGQVSLVDAMEDVETSGFAGAVGMSPAEIREALEAARGGRSNVDEPEADPIQAMNVAEQLVRETGGDASAALSNFRREFDAQPVGSVSEQERAMALAVLEILREAATETDGVFRTFGTEIGGG